MATEGVELEDARTFYPMPRLTRYQIILEEEPEDPNAPFPLCRECADEHHAQWDETWAAYYNSRY